MGLFDKFSKKNTEKETKEETKEVKEEVKEEAKADENKVIDINSKSKEEDNTSEKPNNSLYTCYRLH